MGVRSLLRHFLEVRGKMGSNVLDYCALLISNQIPRMDVSPESLKEIMGTVCTY